MRVFVVVVLAEWGDLSQILTANLATHYHSPLAGVAAVLTPWVVAAIAVTSGKDFAVGEAAGQHPRREQLRPGETMPVRDCCAG
jgi:hypothetical protein